MTMPELQLELTDNEWALDYIDHDRQIARAIVVDGAGYYYFVRSNRDDDFGRASVIETSGGGIEAGETPDAAVIRELREELGAEVTILCKLGVVSDYYNRIHRHNINHYFLCRAVSFGERHLTQMEIERFHLAIERLTFAEAAAEYKRCTDTKFGRLVCQRELPVLLHAKEVLAAL